MIGGCASTRFHRNPGDLRLTKPAQDCIKALRKLESLVKMWELAPRNDLLGDYEDSKAFLSADPGRTYALFFLEGGSATLNLTGCKGKFSLKWINPFTGQWGQTATIPGGNQVKISTPDDGSWLLAIVSSEKQ